MSKVQITEISRQDQTPLICSMAIDKNPDDISQCQYRNITDWINVIKYDPELIRVYKDHPVDNDISKDDILEIFMTYCKRNVNIFETMGMSPYDIEESIRDNIIIRFPKSIKSIDPDISEIYAKYGHSEYSECIPYFEDTIIDYYLLNLISNVNGHFVQLYKGDDPNVYLNAVKITGSSLKYITEDKYSPDLLEEAIKNDLNALETLEDKYITVECIKWAFLQDPELTLKYCSHKINCKNDIYRIVSMNPTWIQYFKGNQDLDSQLFAVNSDPNNLQYVDLTKDNFIVRERAIELDPMTIRFCGRFRNENICRKAYELGGAKVLDYIPKNFIEIIINE